MCNTVTSIVVNALGKETDNCDNKDCIGRQLAHLEYCMDRDVFNIKGLGPAVIKLLHQAGHITAYQPVMIFDVTHSQLTGLGLSDREAENIMKAIAVAHANLDLTRMIRSFGIGGIAKNSSEQLAIHFQNLEALSTATVDDLIHVDDIGKIGAASIFEYFDEDRTKPIEESSFRGFSVCDRLTGPTNLGKVLLNGVTVVVTGSKFSGRTRKETEEAYKQLGAKITSSVTAKTSMVVCGTKYTAHKLEKAKELNVPWIIHDETKIVEKSSPDEITFLNIEVAPDGHVQGSI